MDNDLSGRTESEVATHIMNHPEEGAILGRQELQRRLIKEQYELNKAVMKEQHRLNKRVVMIAAVISALAGLFGGVIGGYTQYLLGKNQQGNCTETTQNTRPTVQAIKHLKVLHDATTTKENVSSKPPPKDGNDKNR